MARTKADAGKKAGGKAPRKAPVLRTTPAPKAGGVSKRKSSGGAKNAYCKRPIPKWQKPIGEFLSKAGSSKESAAVATSGNEKELNGNSACEAALGSSFQGEGASSLDYTTTSSVEEENGVSESGSSSASKKKGPVVVANSNEGEDKEMGEGEDEEMGVGEDEEMGEGEDEEMGEEEETEAEKKIEVDETEAEKEVEDETEAEKEVEDETEAEKEIEDETQAEKEIADEEKEKNEKSNSDVSMNGQVLVDAAKCSTSSGIQEDLSQIPETPNEELEA